MPPEAGSGATKPRTVEQVHAGLFWARGKASEYPCPCGSAAEVWAYQYPSEGELTSPSGTKYSEDFEAYAPMCRSCHFHFDAENDPALVESRRLAKVNGGKATKALLEADPGRMERLLVNLQGGWENRMCSCGYISNAGAVGSHKKRTGHA